MRQIGMACGGAESNETLTFWRAEWGPHDEVFLALGERTAIVLMIPRRDFVLQGDRYWFLEHPSPTSYYRVCIVRRGELIWADTVAGSRPIVHETAGALRAVSLDGVPGPIFESVDARDPRVVEALCDAPVLPTRREIFGEDSEVSTDTPASGE